MRIRSQRLPREYQQVKYIESSGTQYINTNYIPKVNNVNLELDIAWVGNTLGAFETFMGFMKSTTENNPRIGLHKYSSKLMFGANSTTTSEIAPVKNERFIYRGDFTSGAQKLYKNGTQIASNSTTYNFSTNTCPVYIFARYCPNSMNYSTIRVYRAKIYEGTTLKMDFIPCYRKSDNVIGLYDLVNGTFYTNAGSGTFIKGNDIKDSFKISTAIAEGTTNLGETSMNYSNHTDGSTVACIGWGGDAGTCTFYHSGGYNNYPYKIYHKTATGTGGIYFKTANDITIEAGKTYTMSVYIKASVNVNNASAYSFNINRGSDNYYINYGASFNITTNWKRLVKTFTATSLQAGLYGEMSIIYDDNVTDYYVYYSGFQIEEKDHVTPYIDGTREDNTVINFKPHTTLLPPEYQQTEYTANTNGAQYIEYPFVPNYNKGWKFEIGFNPTDTTTRYALTANYNVGSYQVSLELRANAKARLWCNSGSKDMDSSNSFIANQLNNATFSYYSGVCTIVLNGVTTTSSATVSGICSSTSMYMFLDKAKRTSTFPKPIKIYYLRVYDGTDLVFNLIPCYRKSDNVIGMYDIVNKVFYSNSGTGNFTKGNNNVIII